MKKPIPRKRQRRPAPRGESGNAIIEFSLAMSFSVMLLFGTLAVGINLSKGIQAAQIARDAAHMFASGIDFSKTANKNELINITNGTGMTVSGGNGVIVLTALRHVFAADCTAAGLQANATSCPNYGKDGTLTRVVIGDSTLRTSYYGTPTTVASNGGVDYLRDTGGGTTNFAAVMTLTAGQVAYVAEVYLSSPDLSYLNEPSTGGIYARAVF